MSHLTTTFLTTTNSSRREPKTESYNHHGDQKSKSNRSTHLGITIRWRVEAAAPASTAVAGGGRC
jgi:hypothetical protein